jgi:hypothetical protein
MTAESLPRKFQGLDFVGPLARLEFRQRSVFDCRAELAGDP